MQVFAPAAAALPQVLAVGDQALVQMAAEHRDALGPRVVAELLMAVSSSSTGNRIMTSPDGITWALRNTPASTGWRSICWSPQRRQFAAVSNSGAGNRVMVSP